MKAEERPWVGSFWDRPEVFRAVTLSRRAMDAQVEVERNGQPQIVAGVVPRARIKGNMGCIGARLLGNRL